MWRQWFETIISAFHLPRHRYYYSDFFPTLIPFRSIIYQGVRKFAVHFLQDRNVTNTLIIELLIVSPDSDGLQTFFEDLLRHILTPTVSNFDLLQYTAYIKAHSTRGGPIKEFYKRSCAQSNTTSSELLAKIQTQAPSLTHKQTEEFLLPLIGDIMDVMDLSSCNAHGFFYSLFTIYITQTMQQEPQRPRDQARLEEAAPECFRKDCEVCPRIIEFLKNSETETMKFPCDDPWHLRHTSYVKYLEVQPHKSGDGKEEVTLTKTIRWWEEKHRKWEERCSTTLEALRKLPQAKIKECLSDRYDDIMDLRAVKLHSNSHATGLKRSSQSQNHNRAGSPVPRKRPRVSEVQSRQYYECLNSPTQNGTRPVPSYRPNQFRSRFKSLRLRIERQKTIVMRIDFQRTIEKEEQNENDGEWCLMKKFSTLRLTLRGQLSSWVLFIVVQFLSILTDLHNRFASISLVCQIRQEAATL